MLAYWEGHGRAHFRCEEEVPLPAYAAHADPYDALVARVLCDHVAIRYRIAALERESTTTVTALRELASLISGHVRREERELFPLIESTLPAAELAAVVAALDQADDES